MEHIFYPRGSTPRGVRYPISDNECYGSPMRFNVGDFITPTVDHYERRRPGQSYMVSEAKFGTRQSNLIRVGKSKTWLKAANFELVERGQTDMSEHEEGPWGNNKYIIFLKDAAKNVRPAGLANTEEEVNERVKSLLASNPRNKYRVFKFDREGSLPELPIVWSTEENTDA